MPAGERRRKQLPRTLTCDVRVDYLIEHNVPFVCHGKTQHAERHAWVDTNARDAFAGATRRLLDLDHERIALLNMPARYHTAGLRTEGYVSAMRSAGQDLVTTDCELTMDSGHEAALAC